MTGRCRGSFGSFVSWVFGDFGYFDSKESSGILGGVCNLEVCSVGGMRGG